MQQPSPVSSLADIVAKYPELKEVYEEEILNSEHLIRMLDISRNECSCCNKDGPALEECRYQTFDYDQVRLSIRSCMCDKQKYHYRLKKINSLLGNSRIGDRFKSRTFETFVTNDANKNAYQKCKNYADKFPHDDGQGLILIGGYGTGKTHLAVAILHELLRKDVAALFATVPELLEEIRKTFGGDKGSAKSNLLHSIKTAKFLILDDLGAEKATDWVREQLFMIINARYEDMLPTIITSNLLIDELEKQIGARTVSRIIEMCEGVIFDGDDYRKNKLK